MEIVHFDVSLYDEGENWEPSTAAIFGVNDLVLFEDGSAFNFERRPKTGDSKHAHDGDILSPMPGKIIAVEVTQGQAVTKGQKLLTLEAMKMEHTLVAPFDGVVAELSAVAGAQVLVEALLARIEASDTPGENA